jgi:two-component system LytT family response regulator
MQTGAPATGTATKDYFFIKFNGRYEKILVSELLFVEAADNYVLLHTTAKKYLVYCTLKSMVASLPASHFIKVHKSFIVAFDKINGLEGNQLFIGKHTIPVSRNFKEAVIVRLSPKKIV